MLRSSLDDAIKIRSLRRLICSSQKDPALALGKSRYNHAHGKRRRRELYTVIFLQQHKYRQQNPIPTAPERRELQ